MQAYESYIEGLERRWEQQRQADVQAGQRARRLAEQLAQMLHRRYGASRVVLVGSLARGEFRSGSDIDLAAEGISDEAFFRAGADLDAEAEGLHVDLIPLESATPAFLEELARDGIVLYDRANG